MKGYEKLDDVLARAYKQASEGKGKERHANDLPFHEQPMQQVNRIVGVGFSHGQAIKKIAESQNMAPEQAVHELLGAIVYIAGGIISLEAANDNKSGEPIKAVSMTMFVDGKPLNKYPHPDIKFETVEYLKPMPNGEYRLQKVNANECIGGDWIRVPEGADTCMNFGEYFTFYRNNFSEGFQKESEKFVKCYFDLKKLMRNGGRIVWQRKTSRDQAREILSKMVRGEIANINGQIIDFDRDGYFNMSVKRGCVLHKYSSTSLNTFLDYLFPEN